jgi:hypothetical protein
MIVNRFGDGVRSGSEMFLAETIADIGLRPPGHVIDRIDNNGNYERGNLRWAPYFGSACNKRGHSDKSSIYKGVCWIKKDKRWLAQIGFTGNYIRVGAYYTPLEAALHYDMAARCLHGQYADLNFPLEESDHILLSDRALAKINQILFGERIDWLTAMRAQDDTIKMINESVSR